MDESVKKDDEINDSSNSGHAALLVKISTVSLD
jgi:hypothetical protein